MNPDQVQLKKMLGVSAGFIAGGIVSNRTVVEASITGSNTDGTTQNLAVVQGAVSYAEKVCKAAAPAQVALAP